MKKGERMQKKEKFKLEITRVKLNPEQAVLTCCYASVATSGAVDPCTGASPNKKDCSTPSATSAAAS